jgi:hypothetical protein
MAPWSMLRPRHTAGTQIRSLYKLDFLRDSIGPVQSGAQNRPQPIYFVLYNCITGEAHAGPSGVFTTERGARQIEAILRVLFIFQTQPRRSQKEPRNRLCGYSQKPKFSSKVGLSAPSSTHFHISANLRNCCLINISFIFNTMSHKFDPLAIGTRRALPITTNTFGPHQS